MLSRRCESMFLAGRTLSQAKAWHPSVDVSQSTSGVRRKKTRPGMGREQVASFAGPTPTAFLPS